MYCPLQGHSCDANHMSTSTSQGEAGRSLLGSLLPGSLLEGTSLLTLLPVRLPVPWLAGISLLIWSTCAEPRWLAHRDPLAVPGSASESARGSQNVFTKDISNTQPDLNRKAESSLSSQALLLGSQFCCRKTLLKSMGFYEKVFSVTPEPNRHRSPLYALSR